MSNKENYFPPNTPIEHINDTLYTDYSFLSSQSDAGGSLIENQCNDEGEYKEPSEPPF